MQIVGIAQDQWESIVSQVSRELYDGNVICNPDTHDMSTSRTARTVGTLRVRDSHDTGARTSWSGRHGPWACWHVHRDVFREAFRQYPDARITTAMARYTAANFEDTYPPTAWKNVGSMMAPVTMPELCEC